MVKEFSAISELKYIREQKSRLSERENELSTPMLVDVEIIPQMYEWFAEILSKMDFPPNLDSVIQRKKFMYMPNGIRMAFEKLFPNVKPCTLSNNISDITFLYRQYKEFRMDVGYVYTEIMNRLKVKGLIK